MTFLNPALLAAGVACVSIPIIIHLLMHRRRTPVRWGAMRFLLEAYKRQQRRLMLEKWLLLACRCLLVLLVALAIGKPILGGSAFSPKPTTLFILIDNSVTSRMKDAGDAPDASGRSALERHRVHAKALLAGLRGKPGEGHRAALIALASPAEGTIMPPTTDLAAVESMLDQVEASDSKADITGGLAVVAAALAPRPEQNPSSAIAPERTLVAVLSEFRAGSLALAGVDQAARPARLPEGVRLIVPEPAASTPANVSITGVQPVRSVLLSGNSDPGSELVRVELARSQDQASRDEASTTVWAALVPSDSSQAARPAPGVSVRWQPGQETAVAVVPIRSQRDVPASEAGASAGSGRPQAGSRVTGVVVVGIEPVEGAGGPDAIGVDNRFRAAMDVRESLRVGVIAPSRFGRTERADKLDPGEWARLALAPAGEGAGIEVIDIEPAAVDAARLAGLDAAILPRPDLIPEQSWPRLKLFLDSGGLVMILPPPPPPGVNVHLWPDAMTKALGADWSLARESVAVNGVKPVRPSGAGGDQTRPTDQTELLTLIQGELDALLGSVSVERVLAMQPKPEHGSVLLSAGAGGEALLWAGRPSASPEARGMVIYLGVALDLEWSDMPAKPLMVPLVQELVRQGIGRARGSFTGFAGQRLSVPGRSTQLEAIADPARGTDKQPGKLPAAVRTDESGVSDAVRHAGVWRAIDAGGAFRALVTVNADPRGCRTDAQSKQSIGAWLAQAVSLSGQGRDVVDGQGGPSVPGDQSAGKDAIVWMSGAGQNVGDDAAMAARAFSSVDQGGPRGSPISWPLLVGAAVLVLIELLLARSASHASVSGGGLSGASIVPGLNVPGLNVPGLNVPGLNLGGGESGGASA